jgi:ribose transport system substrate-binding protein
MQANRMAAWAALACIALLSGWAPQHASGQASAPARVALVLKTRTNPFFVEMEKGARRAQAQWSVELVVKTPPQETSVEQQINIIEQLVQERVQAIVVTPVDSVRVVPALKRARDAGIVVIDVDTRLDAQALREAGMAPVPFISVDNQAGAYQAVKYLARQVRGTAEAAIIEGISGTSTAQDRKRGAIQALAEVPRIKLVAAESANWKIEEAHEVAKRLFATHPSIKVLFCANDLMALGAIRYLHEAGIEGVKVAGYDALQEAREAIQAGTLAASVDQQAGEQGFTGVAYAARALRGEKLPAQTLLDTRLVTR